MRSLTKTFIVFGSLVLILMSGVPADAQQAVKMEWLSWSHFRFTSPTGKVILTNPYLDNPDNKTKLEDLKKVDIILVADGHRDEIGSAVEIAKQTKARVVAVNELSNGYLASKGVPREQRIPFAGTGDRYRIEGITIRLVNSLHGSGVPDRAEPYGGPAAGFFITFENGLTVYFSGSTDITMDMQLWGSLFKPDVAILHLSANRDPLVVAQMVRLLRTDNPNLKTVIPHHHLLKPPPGGTSPKDLEDAIKALNLPVMFLNPALGKEYMLTK